MIMAIGEWIGLSWPMLALAALAIFAGALVQGLSGLGLGLVAGPVLVAIDPRIGPGPLLAIAFLMSGIMVWREFGAIDRGGLALSLGGRAAGSAVAAVIYAWLTVTAYELIFGITILAAEVLSVVGLRIERTPWNLVSAGFTSGIMGTLTGAGSPTIALIYQRSDGPTVRATLSAFFLASSAISLAVLLAVGKVGPRQWAFTAFSLPVMLLGLGLAGRLVKRLSNRNVRWFVLGLSGASALLLIVRAVFRIAQG